jgi:hypothetical protein
LSIWTSTTPRKSSKIKFAVSGFALVAAAAGTVSVWPASAAAERPASASQARPADPVTSLALALTAERGSRTSVTDHPQLDAFSVAASTNPAPKGGAPAHHKRRYVRLTPRQVARQMLRSFHWTQWQFRWLNRLWSRESSWNVHASNPYSGAYGIPQAVPGAKMASAGPNWTSSARTQIRWGLKYIKAQYGSPHMAWEHELATGWY